MYSRYVTVLKFLQLLGYLGALIFSSALLPAVDETADFVIVLLAAISLCILNYILTQGFIAIVDLLNNIEANTRKATLGSRPASQPQIPSDWESKLRNWESKRSKYKKSANG